MIKKLVCLDVESERNIGLLSALFRMNRSQLIRFLLQEKVKDIQNNQFNTRTKALGVEIPSINLTKSEHIPKKSIGSVING